MEFITTDQRIAVENFSIGRIYTITFKNSSSITRACIGKGADYVMFQETAPKMLFTLNMQTAATVDTIEPGTGTGTYDYDDLENKPQINSVTLSGNKSSSDLGLQDAISSEDPLPASYVSGLATVATTGAYSDLSGLPTLGTAAAAATTDFATAAQGSKADAADTAISTAATGYASLDARLDSMDTNISGKQAALTESQLDAVNSGIDSTKVAQIETNKTNILTLTPVIKQTTSFTASAVYSLVTPCMLTIPFSSGENPPPIVRISAFLSGNNVGVRGIAISLSSSVAEMEDYGKLLSKSEQATGDLAYLKTDAIFFNSSSDTDLNVYIYAKFAAAENTGRIYAVMEYLRPPIQ